MENGKYRWCCSARLGITFCLFLSTFTLMMVMVSISFAVVCMSSMPKRHISNNSDCPFHLSSKTESGEFEFSWSKTLIGYLISGIFYGFVLSQIFAGYVCYKFGGRRVLLVSLALTAVLQFLTPVSVRFVNIHLMFALRVLCGIAMGVVFPATYEVIKNWAVPSESQIIFGLSYSGIPFASIINFPISGVLCKFLGWTAIFYFNGILLVATVLIFFFLLFDFPDSHPRISTKEVEYITTRLRPKAEMPKKIPWKAMIKSVPLHALNVVHFCHVYGYLTVILSLPMYMMDVHKFDLQENSVFSALPYIGVFILRATLSLTFEPLRNKVKLSKTVLRKIFMFLGTFFPAIWLLVITFLTCKHRYIVLVFMMMVPTFGELGITGGYLPSPLDMAPAFSQLISSFIYVMGNAVGIISPLVVGVVTTEGTQTQWNIIFYILIGLYLFEMFVYLTLGSSELQPWAQVNEDERPRGMSFVSM